MIYFRAKDSGLQFSLSIAGQPSKARLLFQRFIRRSTILLQLKDHIVENLRQARFESVARLLGWMAEWCCNKATYVPQYRCVKCAGNLWETQCSFFVTVSTWSTVWFEVLTEALSENTRLLGDYTMLFSVRFFLDCLTLKMNALQSLEMSGTTHSIAQHHIPGDLNP